jgi:hypothetical protein
LLPKVVICGLDENPVLLLKLVRLPKD